MAFWDGVLGWWAWCDGMVVGIAWWGGLVGWWACVFGDCMVRVRACLFVGDSVPSWVCLFPVYGSVRARELLLICLSSDRASCSRGSVRAQRHI